MRETSGNQRTVTEQNKPNKPAFLARLRTLAENCGEVSGAPCRTRRRRLDCIEIASEFPPRKSLCVAPLWRSRPAASELSMPLDTCAVALVGFTVDRNVLDVFLLGEVVANLIVMSARSRGDGAICKIVNTPAADERIQG